MKCRFVVSALAPVVMLSSGALAGTVFSFTNITGTSATNAAAGEAQLFVEVGAMTLGSQDGVLFRFFNTGPAASSIADVYFDGGGSLLSLHALIDADDNSSLLPNVAGVDFTQRALANVSPPNLPGHNNVSPPFQAIDVFSADSDSPVQPNGVNPGEELGVFFTLQTTQNLTDILGELDTGALRIGLHVQGFGDGGSESFVNNGSMPVIPLPTPLAMGLAGLGCVAGMRRRR